MQIGSIVHLAERRDLAAAGLPAGIKGEPGTGYEGPEGGPFRCSNCEYFNGSCGQATMMKESKRPRTPDGRVKVDAGGCCEFVHRKG